MRRFLLLIALFPALAPAQAPPERIFTRSALLQLIEDNHPAARQAALRTDMGTASVRAARGAFDPKAFASRQEKNFENKEYYNLLDAGLRVPTWFGVELYGGLEDNSGELLDPQQTTPAEGLLKAGVSVTVGQGLFIDERRADLRKAQAYQGMADAERLQLLNEVYYNALSDHLDWVAAFKQFGVNTEALAQAVIRLNAVRSNFQGGDRPAIDTLEALLQVQDRELRLRDARLTFRNATVQLSNHLWDNDLRPLEIGEELQPDTNDLLPPTRLPMLDTLLQQAMREHPKLLMFQGKVEQLDIERRLRTEFLKPQLDLNYTLLGRGAAVTEGGAANWNNQNMQWGFGFSMPILLRKERGELSLAKLRMLDAELGLDRERQGIRTTIGQRSNDLAIFQEQVGLVADMVRNSRGLLNGENRRFDAGESSLFLVNIREVAWLESRMKLVTMETKYRRAFYTLDKESGILWRTALAEINPN